MKLKIYRQFQNNTTVLPLFREIKQTRIFVLLGKFRETNMKIANM